MDLEKDKELLMREMRKAAKSNRVFSESEYSKEVVDRLKQRLQEMAVLPEGLGLLLGNASPAVYPGGKRKGSFPGSVLLWRMIRNDRLVMDGEPPGMVAVKSPNMVADLQLAEPVMVAAKRAALQKAGMGLDSMVEETVDSLVGQIAVHWASAIYVANVGQVEAGQKWFSDMEEAARSGKVPGLPKRFEKNAPGWIGAARSAFMKICMDGEKVDGFIGKEVQRRLERLAAEYPESISRVEVARREKRSGMERTEWFLSVEMTLLMKSGGRQCARAEIPLRAKGFAGLVGAAAMKLQGSPVGFVQRNVDRIFGKAVKAAARSAMALGLENIEGNLGGIFHSEGEKEALDALLERGGKPVGGQRRGVL